MKSIRTRFALSVLALSLLTSVSSALAQKSYDAKLDIAALMTQARDKFDFAIQDAVVLSEGQSVRWLPDGRLSMFVHRIVYINSSVAVNKYADSRVPFDKDHCTFSTLALRTWRDNQWWPTDSSGVVETLPFALEKTYDYANIREMMLLHNGIESPCIVELAYRIEDKTPFRRGADGLWLFAREEPALQSWFELGIPSGARLNAAQANGVPTPVKTSDLNAGIDIYTWKMGPLAGQPRPRVADVASEVPYVTWSTWESWATLSKGILAGFESNATLDSALIHICDSLTREARTVSERAQAVAKFVNDNVESIHYLESYWRWNPRKAERTYSTAYGHSLDRAILAGAMFARAGLKVSPVFISDGIGSTDTGVPSVARFGQMRLGIEGDNLDALFDPLTGSLAFGTSDFAGRAVWNVRNSAAPSVIAASADSESSISLRVDLSFDKEKGKFVGTGLLTADHGLAPFDHMVGIKDETKSYLGSLISSLLKGATVTGYNPNRFDRNSIEVGFTFEIAKPDPDDLSRIQMPIGKLYGGVMDILAADVQLFQPERASSVRFPFAMTQRVELRLDISPWQVVYFPTNWKAENETGRFSVISKTQGDKMIIVRELELKQTIVPPSQWAQLRQLLLAENHEKNRTLILKTKKAVD